MCGACKGKLCKAEVDYRSITLLSKEKEFALQACVDEFLGKLEIEIN